MSYCDQHEKHCTNHESHNQKISSLEKDVQHMQEQLSDLKKLPQDFYEFRADMKSMFRTWGIAITGLIAIVGLYSRFVS